MTEIKLGALMGMTIVTPDLSASISAYREYLDYVGAEEGAVGPELARLWGTPAAEAARFAVLRPTTGGDRFLRLVEAMPGDYRPYTSTGWAAAEIVVGDLDRVAERLADSPFRIIGPPAVLDFDFTDQIRAMQVEGPGREVLYLTEVGAEIPGFDLPRATGLVGELFVAVLGGASIDEMAAPYAALGRPAGPAFQARIEVLAAAHGMDLQMRHSLSTVALPDSSLIEIDAFPGACPPRAASAIGLPSGIAIASFAATLDGSPIAEPRLMTGAAGEWIELLP